MQCDTTQMKYVEKFRIVYCSYLLLSRYRYVVVFITVYFYYVVLYQSRAGGSSEDLQNIESFLECMFVFLQIQKFH